MLKGEQSFDALGNRWTLVFGMNAQCAIEDETGTGFVAFINDTFGTVSPAEANDPAALEEAAKRVRMGSIRSLFWAGMLDHHPHATKVEAGRVIDAIGLHEAGRMIVKGVRSAMGEAGDDAPARPTITKQRGKQRTG